MLRKNIFAVIGAVSLILTLAPGVLASSSRAADEKTIRDLDAAWSQAANGKDADKTASFYADDASMLPSNAPIVNGKAQIRESWARFMALPGFSIKFGPTKIVVAKSGDLAYDVGTYQSTANDDKGQTIVTVGKYVVNWEKRGGQWKAVVDIFNNDK